MISYEPFFKTLKEKGISKYRLNKEGISRGTLFSMKQGAGISTHTINRICEILDCEVDGVIKYVKEDKENDIKF